MSANLNNGTSASHHPRDAIVPTTPHDRAWPRFSANAALHRNVGSNGLPVPEAGMRNWTASELAALLCDVLKREHVSLAACHGQRVETDWIPLARSLAIRLAETPGMTLATSPLKTRFLLREQIGAWLVHNALDRKAAASVLIALPETWGSTKVLSYLFRHEIAPMHHVTATARNNSAPIAVDSIQKEENVSATA